MTSLVARGRVRAPQRGIAAVEFALLVFVMLLITAGIVEFGRAVWHYDALAKASRDGARYLSTVNRPFPTTEIDNAKDMVVTAATAAGVPDFTAAAVTVTCAPSACSAVPAAGETPRVTVDVSYEMTLGTWFPFIYPGGDGTFDVTLAPHTTMPYMR